VCEGFSCVFQTADSNNSTYGSRFLANASWDWSQMGGEDAKDRRSRLHGFRQRGAGGLASFQFTKVSTDENGVMEARGSDARQQGGPSRTAPFAAKVRKELCAMRLVRHPRSGDVSIAFR
jgi:hypothetical protein